MEKFYNWQVNCGCSDLEVTEGVIAFVINETLVSSINGFIYKYNKDLEADMFQETLNILIEANNDIGFPSFVAWVRSKEEVGKRLLEMVNTIDLVLSNAEKIKPGALVKKTASS